MDGRREIRLLIETDYIIIPDEFPDMRNFAGEFYENLENVGVELEEGIKELPIQERARNLFLCG